MLSFELAPKILKTRKWPICIALCILVPQNMLRIFKDIIYAVLCLILLCFMKYTLHLGSSVISEWSIMLLSNSLWFKIKKNEYVQCCVLCRLFTIVTLVWFTIRPTTMSQCLPLCLKLGFDSAVKEKVTLCFSHFHTHVSLSLRHLLVCTYNTQVQKFNMFIFHYNNLKKNIWIYREEIAYSAV